MNTVPIKGFEDRYTIAPDGSVRSTFSWSKGRLHKQYVGHHGYYVVTLWTGEKAVTKLIHRLLGEAFIPLVPGKNVVNHKDSNPLNNSLENLEWVTTSENILHFYTNKLHYSEIDAIVIDRKPGYRHGWSCLCVCPTCRKQYWVPESHLKAHHKKFCSRRCGLDYKMSHLVIK